MHLHRDGPSDACCRVRCGAAQARLCACRDQQYDRLQRHRRVQVQLHEEQSAIRSVETDMTHTGMLSPLGIAHAGSQGKGRMGKPFQIARASHSNAAVRAWSRTHAETRQREQPCLHGSGRRTQECAAERTRKNNSVLIRPEVPMFAKPLRVAARAGCEASASAMRGMTTWMAWVKAARQAMMVMTLRHRRYLRGKAAEIDGCCQNRAGCLRKTR